VPELVIPLKDAVPPVIVNVPFTEILVVPPFVKAPPVIIVKLAPAPLFEFIVKMLLPSVTIVLTTGYLPDATVGMLTSSFPEGIVPPQLVASVQLVLVVPVHVLVSEKTFTENDIRIAKLTKIIFICFIVLFVYRLIIK
jgi:hypothetical protein